MKKFNKKDFKISFDQSQTKIHYNGQYVIAELYGYVHVPTFVEDDWFGDNYVAIAPFWVHTRGVARPVEGDTYDKEVGKKIALAKAENKAYAAAIRKLMNRVSELDMFKQSVYRFADKVTNVQEHNNDYINRVGG